jgi:hypothetical protein
MERLRLLKEKVRETSSKYPHLKEEIYDLWQLCIDEIEEGSSIENECSLCENSIDDLIDDLIN